MGMVKFRKRLIFCLLTFCCISTSTFAQSITETENDQKRTVEIVTAERAQKLKELYESRYKYVSIMDSIEMDALRGKDEHDETEISEELKNFREQIKNIPKGEYKVATISMSNSFFLTLGLVYFGYDYYFMVLFTDSYFFGILNLRSTINLSNDRQRYENGFKSSWNMLF
jgi:hypothetical protein